MDTDKKKMSIAIICILLIFIMNVGTIFAQEFKNQYQLYEQYGLRYDSKKNKMYYNGHVVRYFIDRLNNGQGVLSIWAYDFDGMVDLYTVRNNSRLKGDLIGIKAYTQEDFNLRTMEIVAQQNNIPNYDVMTFRFRKGEAPGSLQLWIKQCEDGIFDYDVTQQNGRYYIYVRSKMEFAFGVFESERDERTVMEIYHIDRVNNEGYALFSVPLYRRFTVTYNGVTKAFLN